MAHCLGTTLLEGAGEFASLSPLQLRVLTVVLLQKLLKLIDPMANTTLSALMAEAGEFASLPDQLLQAITVQLLCEIKNAGVGGQVGEGTLLKGDGAPVADPGTTIAVYFDTSPTADYVLYWWNGAGWFPFG